MAEFSRTTTTITVNGKTYHSVEEMPPDVRRQYEQVMSVMADRNNNGVPDIMEGRAADEGTVVSHITTTTPHFGVDDLRQLQSSLLPPAKADGRRESGGITIRISWATLLALLVVAGVALLWWWGKQ